MHNWHSFLWAADEWFITYALPPSDLTCVKLFSIGHTIELYLKAANTKFTNDINRSIKFGHDLKRIWDDCKRDSEFMPSFEIKDYIFNKDLTLGNVIKSLDEADRKHYVKNHELYIVVKYLPDLKYLGAPLKSIKGAYALGYTHPNPYWIDFIREFRNYLGHHKKNRLDPIAKHLQEGDLPEQTTKYLKGLYS